VETTTNKGLEKSSALAANGLDGIPRGKPRDWNSTTIDNNKWGRRLRCRGDASSGKRGERDGRWEMSGETRSDA